MNPHRLNRARRRATAVPLRRLVPNFLTIISLCSGLASLHFSLQMDWDRALSAIAVAAVFDMLDGGAARLLRAASRFGAVLDSLSDFVSFGVAPALMLHQWMLKEAGALGLAATMIFALCAAMRLARFTSARKSNPASPLSKFFIGLPTPAAAGIVLIPVMLATAKNVGYRLPDWIVILHTFFIAWLMISRQPCFSLKKLRVKRGLIVPLMVCVGLVVVSAAKDPWSTAVLLASLYLLSIPLCIMVYRRLKQEFAAQTGAAGAASSRSNGVELPPR
ncbi:MAG: phosphatidylcholine/phosphatidylserine synthase [Phycisphaerae bacterium]|nr:phosphatidylcholine/phosphatidylserine synthase [Phycisphaerae bacterium]